MITSVNIRSAVTIENGIFLPDAKEEKNCDLLNALSAHTWSIHVDHHVNRRTIFNLTFTSLLTATFKMKSNRVFVL